MSALTRLLLLRTVVPLLFLALSGVATAGDPVLTKGTGFRVASARVQGDQVVVAQFAGATKLRATVTYGWLDGVIHDVPEMQLKLHAASARQLPRPAAAEAGFYNSFVISNPQQIATALFGTQALRTLMAGDVAGLEVEAEVAVHKLSFGTDCGLHYEAYALSVAVVPATSVLVATRGAVPHC